MTNPGPSPILFLDTETTRLRRPYWPRGRRTWELAALRRELDGTERWLHQYVTVEDLGLLELLTAGQCDDLGINPRSPDWYDRMSEPAREKLWFEALPDDVRTSLDIGQFHQRHPQRVTSGDVAVSEETLAGMLAEGPWLRDTPLLVAAVPSFDDLGVMDMLVAHGQVGYDAQPWHYRLRCVENLAAGKLGCQFWDTEQMCKTLGMDLTRYVKHRAVDDVRWCADLYDAVFADVAA